MKAKKRPTNRTSIDKQWLKQLIDNTRILESMPQNIREFREQEKELRLSLEHQRLNSSRLAGELFGAKRDAKELRDRLVVTEQQLKDTETLWRQEQASSRALTIQLESINKLNWLARLFGRRV